MTDTFRMPKDFKSLVYLSMLLQAEGTGMAWNTGAVT